MTTKQVAHVFGIVLVMVTLILPAGCGGGGSSGGSDSTKALTEEEADAQAINEFWDSLESLYKTAAPSDEAVREWFESHAADDFLDAGSCREEWHNDWLTDNDLGAGTTFSATVIEGVASGQYAKVYKINLRIDNGWENMETYMVHDGTKWLWQGNQALIRYDIAAQAAMGSGVQFTGFVIRLGGNNGLVGLDQFKSVLVTGPGLPDGRAIFFLEAFDDYFKGNVIPFDDGGYDSQLSAIPDNAQYTFSLCLETESELKQLKEDESPVVLESYQCTLKKGPVPFRDLTSGMFAQLTPPTPDFSELDFGGTITLPVSAPDGTTPGWAVLLAPNSGTNKQELVGSFDAGSSSFVFDATEFDATEEPLPDEPRAVLYFSVIDAYDREFVTGWTFQ